MEHFVGQTKQIRDGGIILEEGAWAYYAYVLRAGKAKVWKNVNDKQVLIGTLKEGDIFGEMSFFGMSRRTASVTADGDVEVGMMNKDAFQRVVDKLPPKTRAKLEKMSQDIFYMNDIYSRLKNCLLDMLNVRGKMADTRVFDGKDKEVPDLIRDIALMMSKRFNFVMSGSVEMMAQLEVITGAIDALSTALYKEPACGSKAEKPQPTHASVSAACGE